MPCTDKACETALRKTKMCAYFRKGRCSRGADCTFAHNPAELNSRPNLSKTRLCIPFQHSGTCMMGMACRFAHDESELRAIRAAEMDRRGFNSVQNSMIREDEVLHHDSMQQEEYWGMPSQDDLEVVLMQDRDFSRQSSMETVHSTFSRQVSQEMGSNPFGRQQTPLGSGQTPLLFQQTPPTNAYPQSTAFHPQQRIVVEMRTSHSPTGSSQESTQDSDSQRVIRLMEHLVAEPDNKNQESRHDYNYDDAVNTDDEIEDVNDITKCLFDEGSYKDNLDNSVGSEVRKFGMPCDNGESSGYNMYGYISPKTSHGAMAFQGQPVLNCNIQNTFLHFSPDLGDAQPLRRSNSLGALPLRGL